MVKPLWLIVNHLTIGIMIITPLYPMVLLIRQSLWKMAISLGNSTQHFQTNPVLFNRKKRAIKPISHGWLVNRRCWLVKKPTEMGDLQWLCEIQKGLCEAPRVSFFSGCDSKSQSDCSANFENKFWEYTDQSSRTYIRYYIQYYPKSTAIL